VLYLDEDTSGNKFVSRLREARIPVQPFESLLRKNKKTPDSSVIERAAGAGYVLVTTDKRMESDWIDDIIRCRAKIILLTDDHGGPIHWTAALVCSQARWRRVLLDHPSDPVTIRIDAAGNIVKVAGSARLLERREHLLTASIARSKRHGAKPKQPVGPT
jgi:hypothetical protein